MFATAASCLCRKENGLGYDDVYRARLHINHDENWLEAL